MRVNRHKQKSKPTVYVYSSLTLSNEEEGVVATGSYDIYTRCLRLWTEVLGGSFRDVYIMQQQQQNEGDIASDPAHYPSLW